MQQHSHISERRTGANHSAPSVCVLAAAQQVRSLLQDGLRDRDRANRMGWTKTNVEATRLAMATVRTWLDRNPHPGAGTLRRLVADHWGAIRCMMPTHAAGRKRLDTLEQIIHSLTP